MEELLNLGNFKYYIPLLCHLGADSLNNLTVLCVYLYVDESQELYYYAKQCGNFVYDMIVSR